MVLRYPQPVGFAIGAAACASLYFACSHPSRFPGTFRSQHPLSPCHFTTSTVLTNESSGPDTKLLQLSIPVGLLPAGHRTLWPIWSVYIKDYDIQVERPYTPLEGVDENGVLRFWIKKYPHGEVGKWIHSKKPGDFVEIRGPLQTWLWKDDDKWDEVVMISGGTGITAFFQLFHTVISRSLFDNKTHFTLLHSSRTPADLPPTCVIEPLTTYAKSHPEKLKVQFFVDSDDVLSKKTSRFPSVQVGTIDRSVIEHSIGLQNNAIPWWQKLFRGEDLSQVRSKKILFLVCGPEPMIKTISGPYGRYFSQGKIGGLLGEMGFRAEQVWKF